MKPAGIRPFRILALLAAALTSLPGLRAGNPAIVPVAKLENDSYDWDKRHQEVLETKSRIQPEVVLIGDSITHFWGGEPRSALARGPEAWKSLFGSVPTLNLGFGWDRTQNVLWRIDHGELDGIQPRVVVIHIGTNNTSGTQNARANTAPEIAAGVATVCDRVRAKLPKAEIVLMAIFPREESPDHPRRKLIAETNTLLAKLAAEMRFAYLDIGRRFLAADGTLPRAVMSDFCHPTEAGYRIWADALRPHIHPIAFPDPANLPGKGTMNTTWPGFRNCWENRQKGFRQTSEADRGSMVFLGDSITECAPLAALFPGTAVCNRGISGDTSRGMLYRLDDNVLALSPSAVVILAGTNDLFQPGNSPESTAANILEMCRNIRSRMSAVPVIVGTIPPSAKPGAADAAMFNAEIARALDKLPGVTLVDTHSPFLKDGKQDGSLFKDGVHPNQKGYEVFSKALAPHLPVGGNR